MGKLKEVVYMDVDWQWNWNKKINNIKKRKREKL
jgi:hypothetical protein